MGIFIRKLEITNNAEIYFMELSGRSNSERLDNQREIFTNGGDLPRDLGSGEPRNWDGEANLVVYQLVNWVLGQ